MTARLIWWIERRTPQLAAAVGAALVVLTLVTQAVLIAPLEQRRQALIAQTSRVAATQRGADNAAAADTPQAQLAGFYSHFQPGVSLADGLGRVHQIATGLGLELSSADYQLSSPPDQKLARYRMNVNLRASYPQLRRFVGSVLRELPTLALDQVDVQRKEIGDTDLDVRLSLSFYLATP